MVEIVFNILAVITIGIGVFAIISVIKDRKCCNSNI